MAEAATVPVYELLGYALIALLLLFFYDHSANLAGKA